MYIYHNEIVFHSSHLYIDRLSHTSNTGGNMDLESALREYEHSKIYVSCILLLVMKFLVIYFITQI